MRVELPLKTAGETLTVLEGKTLEPVKPVKIVIAGYITSVADYLKKRFRDRLDVAENGANGYVLQKVDRHSAVILVDEEELSITLKLDPENVNGTEISGHLEFTKHLEQFGINQPTLHTREALVKLLRFSKQLFDDVEKYEELLKAYQTFDFKSFIEASKEDDTRGNRSAAVKKRVETNLPNGFALALPIFKGQAKEKFWVDICYDTTDASIKFWFESVELANLIEQRKIEIFEEQLKEFQDFVIIHL